MTFRTSIAFAVCSALLTLSSLASAQIVTIGPPPAKTRLEALELQEGVTIVQGRSFIGAVNGLSHGRIVVIAREMTSMATGTRESGVTVSVTESAVRGKDRDAEVRDNTSYIDHEELPGLIRGLEQLWRLDRTSTRLDQFGGEYRTKGYFRVSVRGVVGDVRLSVSSGLTEPVTTSFQITDLNKIRDLFVDALAELDALK
jgi:hypothetical protein